MECDNVCASKAGGERERTMSEGKTAEREGEGDGERDGEREGRENTGGKR